MDSMNVIHHNLIDVMRHALVQHHTTVIVGHQLHLHQLDLD
ncbi:unnamed protein product [Trichobilharzia regenti]|nr:unnamed protein product [Trichobilharzia regenti]